MTKNRKLALGIVAFMITAVLSLIELGLIETPVDPLLQTGSALLGIVAKPVTAIIKFLG